MPLTERQVTRRKFLQLMITWPLALACSKEHQQTPILVVQNDNKIHEAPDLKKILTRDAGVRKMAIFSDPQTGFTHVKLQLTDFQLTFQSVDRKRADLADGFVPFDPKFNVDKALKTLKQHYQTKPPPQLSPGEFTKVQLWFAQNESEPQSPNVLDKIITSYHTPQDGLDYMYVFWFGELYLHKGRIPPMAIVKTRFRFTSSR